MHTNATRMIENVRTQLRDLFAVEKSKEVALKKLLDTYRVCNIDLSLDISLVFLRKKNSIA